MTGFYFICELVIASEFNHSNKHNRFLIISKETRFKAQQRYQITHFYSLSTWFLKAEQHFMSKLDQLEAKKTQSDYKRQNTVDTKLI